MSELIPTLTVVDGVPTTTSLQVAEHFEKQHNNVLRDIRDLLQQLPAGYALNFERIQTESDLGHGRFRRDPAYRLTKNGFVLLAMGFTGAKALAFKLAYIEAFDQHERIAREAMQEKLSRATILPRYNFTRPSFPRLERYHRREINRKATALATTMADQVRDCLLWRLGEHEARFGPLKDHDFAAVMYYTTAEDVASFAFARDKHRFEQERLRHFQRCAEARQP